MGVPGDLLLVLIGVTLVLVVPLEIALGTLIAFWLLVPGSLSVPFAPHVVLVDRLILYAFTLRLVLRSGRPGEPKGSAYALNPMHAALGVLLVVGFLDGVILPSQRTSLSGDIHGWLYLLDLAVLFVGVLAVARTIGVERVARMLAGTLFIVIVIGIAEALTKRGWSAFFFEHLPANYQSVGAVGLIERSGNVRPQVAAQFSVEYGWVLAIVFPFAIYAAIGIARQRGRFTRFAFVLPLGIVLCELLAASRSAEAVILVEMVLFAAASGVNRHVFKWVAALIGAGALFFVFNPSFITTTFSAGASNDPLSVRLDRLPVLFALAGHHPFSGVGFSGTTIAIGGIDNAYALIYTTIGVIGLCAWIGVFVAAVAVVAPSLRFAHESDERVLGAACLIGIVGAVIASAIYDFQNTVQSPWTLIVLAAMGAAVAERVPRRVRVHRRWAVRMVVPATGVILGFILLAVTPTSASETMSIQTGAAWVMADSTQPFSPYQGTMLVRTLCLVVTNPASILPGTAVGCQQAVKFGGLHHPGLALISVRGPTPAAVRSEITRAFLLIHSTVPIGGGLTETMQVGKPAWVTTGPLLGGLLGLLVVLIVPPIRLREIPTSSRDAVSARR